MPRPHRFFARSWILFACFTALFAGYVRAGEVDQRMKAASAAFLDSLSGIQLDAALREFDEERKDWHFVPRKRKGLPLSSMNEEQRRLAFALIAEGLSEQGLRTVEDIRSLETVLQLLEGPDRYFPRDPENYYLSVFASSGRSEWGWSFEGHHISINATVVPGEGVSMSPRFLGANPAEVPSGERKGFRALGDEEDLAFALAESLTAVQAEKAVFQPRAPRDIFTGAHRKVSPLPVEGIAYSELDTDQRRLLRSLLECYLAKAKEELRNAARAKIEAEGWESIRFGWAGPIDREMGNYYYLQGPSFLIEYDNTQNGNNHIHSVWREFEGDFGEDLIRAHRHQHAH
ncbi:DUF3500 domain-containing protein [Pelagicoccus sp. SDUM812005]|uniref:DUF3500 domain-containing protein n=1 Tax=Pelagicoccus sp. SDUM812005 TaxID=3041257 RepID=UPI00280C5BB6|nr:DUF3500 domain-containing protein [Pelagicoccus sp. SDUM812005]MDQ8181640.1 DUF3500 domain-containing protein [Pelagicoccus sp. SDUM812005]